MGRILIIGGGDLGNLETLPFDKRNVELSGKKRPRALFIPTASGEAERYVQIFNKIYGKRLGCSTDVLYLLNKKPTKRELRKKILLADIIYVGGGNTLKMMNRWRFLGVDKILKEAYKKNIVLTGISAGGICWFEYGHSDSMSFGSDAWRYIRVKGLGLIKGIHCPHFDGETKGKKRKNFFFQFMQKYSEMGIAIDNHCAMEFIDGKYRVLCAKKGRKAYRVFKKKGKLVLEEIPQKREYSPMSELFRR